jgi:Resolvase, N terminal domain
MRAALYARTACLTQDLKSAVELQLEALRNYATQNGMEIVDEFTDAGYSGLRRDRPGLDRMWAGAERRDFDVLVVQDPARLARNAALEISLLEKLEQRRVRTIFLEAMPYWRSAFDAKVSGASGHSEWFAAAMRKLSTRVQELVRETFGTRCAPPKQGCQGLPSNRPISYRGGK